MASLLLGFCFLLLWVSLPTTTLWVSRLSIWEAELSEMSCDSAATTKVFNWSILLINLSLVATAAAAVWRYDNLVQALLVGGDAGGHPMGGFEDPLAVSRATANVTALARVMFCSARRSCWSFM